MSERGGGGKWKMDSTRSLEAAANWLRKQADAQVVIVLRAQDGAIAFDETIDVMDVKDRVWLDLPKLLGVMRELRDKEREERQKRARGAKR